MHGMSQAKILERVAISFSRVSPPIRDQTLVSCTGRGFFTTKPTGKPQLPSPALSLSLSVSPQLGKFTGLKTALILGGDK